jgi:hypothetical protein
MSVGSAGGDWDDSDSDSTAGFRSPPPKLAAGRVAAPGFSLPTTPAQPAHTIGTAAAQTAGVQKTPISAQPGQAARGSSAHAGSGVCAPISDDSDEGSDSESSAASAQCDLPFACELPLAHGGCMPRFPTCSENAGADADAEGSASSDLARILAELEQRHTVGSAAHEPRVALRATCGRGGLRAKLCAREFAAGRW